MAALTRKQQWVFDYLQSNWENFTYPPTLDELCIGLGLASRGALYRHILALINAGLVEPFTENKHAGIRLSQKALDSKPENSQKLPFLGKIAAGLPIEAIANRQYMEVPAMLKSDKPCYVLQVKGDSMIEKGILDGDWVVIEQRQTARNGEIVVALIDQVDATLKMIEQTPKHIKLHPANANMEVQVYGHDQVEIQGVLIAQMRRYH
jgi:repressor LexA